MEGVLTEHKSCAYRSVHTNITNISMIYVEFVPKVGERRPITCTQYRRSVIFTLRHERVLYLGNDPDPDPDPDPSVRFLKRL